MELAIEAERVPVESNDQRSTAAELLSVVVPCHNEAATVSELLKCLRSALPEAEIVVVDDGSSDASVERIHELQNALDLRLVSCSQCRGKGSAVREGLLYATRKFVVIQDADLEYDPGDLRRLALTAAANPDCAIYGSRYLQRGKALGGSLVPYLGVKTLAALVSLLYGRHLSDPHACYKMLPTALMRRLALKSQGFELCAEITGKLLREGVPIIEVPVSYQPRTAAEGKKIGYRDFLRSASVYVECRRAATVNPADGEPSSHVRSSLAYFATRFLIGALLVVGGAQKLAPWREVALLYWLVLPAWAVFAVGVIEFVLGCLVLSFAPWRFVSWACRAVFTLYIVILALQLWAGESVCQCLGSRSLPIFWMIVIDSLLLLSMQWFATQWQQHPSVPRNSTSNPFLEVLSATRYALTFLLLIGAFRFGSADAAISYATGARLLATSSAQYVGALQENEIGSAVFELTNESRQSINVLGAKASCKCLAWDDLPMTLAPGESRDIRIRMKGQSVVSPQIQRETATLIFDDPTRSLQLKVTASVLPPP